MSKIAVVFWSGTGNTEQMAYAVMEGIKEKAAEAALFAASEFGASMVKQYDAIAFGCPAMGAEHLAGKKLLYSVLTDGATVNGCEVGKMPAAAPEQCLHARV